MTKKLQKRQHSGTSKTGVGAGAGCFACGDYYANATSSFFLR